MSKVIRLVKKVKMPEKKTQVMIADDHQIIRDGLRVLINRQKDMEVAGEAETGREAVQLARELRPDVIIMDVTMPELSGIDATRLIMAGGEKIKIIGLSMHSDRSFILGMLMSGACGYLLKDCAFDELADAIRQVMKNNTYLSSGIPDSVARDVVKQKGCCNRACPGGTAETEPRDA